MARLMGLGDAPFVPLGVYHALRVTVVDAVASGGGGGGGGGGGAGARGGAGAAGGRASPAKAHRLSATARLALRQRPATASRVRSAVASPVRRGGPASPGNATASFVRSVTTACPNCVAMRVYACYKYSAIASSVRRGDPASPGPAASPTAAAATTARSQRGGGTEPTWQVAPAPSLVLRPQSAHAVARGSLGPFAESAALAWLPPHLDVRAIANVMAQASVFEAAGGSLGAPRDGVGGSTWREHRTCAFLDVLAATAPARRPASAPARRRRSTSGGRGDGVGRPSLSRPVSFLSAPVEHAEETRSLHGYKRRVRRYRADAAVLRHETAGTLQRWFRGERVRHRIRALAVATTTIAAAVRGRIVAGRYQRAAWGVTLLAAVAKGGQARAFLRHMNTAAHVVECAWRRHKQKVCVRARRTCVAARARLREGPRSARPSARACITPRPRRQPPCPRLLPRCTFSACGGRWSSNASASSGSGPCACCRRALGSACGAGEHR